MKKYIFLTNTIGFVGGSQLYISRKVEYLRKQNWDVEVFYETDEGAMIENLKPFLQNHLQILSVPFELVSRKQKEKILELFTPCDCCIIESHLIGYSVWGEYVAKHIGAKHIVYFLCEQFPLLDNSMLDFLKFKLKQNLLYGITSKSIPALLGENFDGTPYGLLAVGCHASVGGIDSRIEQLPKADYTILSLGRLNKPYIPEMLASVIEFAKSHKECKINFIIIGDGMSDKLVLSPFVSVNNVKVLLAGSLFPIPLNAFLLSDVAIATAGCVKIASECDVPTIVVDGNDYKAIGVYDYTTSNILFRDFDEPPLKIEDVLEDVLVKKKYSSKGLSKFEKQELDYSAHQVIIDQEFENEYYDVSDICNSKSWSIERFVAYSCGWKVYIKYMRLKSVVKKFLKRK